MTFALSAFIFVFFRIINFCILVALFWHVFNKYFYRDLKIHVRKQLDWWLVLRNKIMQLRVKQKELDITIANEQWMAQRLLKNIDRWRLFVQQENKCSRQEQQERLLKLQEIQTIQDHNYRQTVLKRAYTPELFLKAQDRLKIYYAQEPKARVFIDRSLHMIRDRS